MREQIFTVSEINKLIKGIINQQREFANVEVQGEISNFKKYPSGHCYFNLKDARSSLKAVMFAGSARYLKTLPLNGDKVLAIGHLDVYERDGVYQLYVDMLLPQGTGSLMVAFEQLKEKLTADGLFAEENKQPLPLNPKRIGIITSSAGAAVRDIIKVSKSRNKAVELYLYPVRVQGEEAAGEIAHAIKYFNGQDLVDVLIVGRGGGSMEDLWAFNEEVVVRAIAASQLPIVSAVGHETDFTLADFAADVRAATPSAAAEIVVEDVNALTNNLQHLQHRQVRALQRLLEVRQERMQRLSNSWIFRQPGRLWETKALTLDKANEAMPRSLEKIINQKQQLLALKAMGLQTLNPLNILARGYTLTERLDGTLVRSRAGLQAGDKLVTRFKDGSVISEVEQEGSK